MPTVGSRPSSANCALCGRLRGSVGCRRPPLLCDRVTGIDGEPGSMGLMVELDRDRRLLVQLCYLHDGRMPAGVMIESGQADLCSSISLGIDAPETKWQTPRSRASSRALSKRPSSSRRPAARLGARRRALEGGVRPRPRARAPKPLLLPAPSSARAGRARPRGDALHQGQASLRAELDALGGLGRAAATPCPRSRPPTRRARGRARGRRRAGCSRPTPERASERTARRAGRRGLRAARRRRAAARGGGARATERRSERAVNHARLAASGARDATGRTRCAPNLAGADAARDARAAALEERIAAAEARVGEVERAAADAAALAPNVDDAAERCDAAHARLDAADASRAHCSAATRHARGRGRAARGPRARARGSARGRGRRRRRQHWRARGGRGRWPSSRPARRPARAARRGLSTSAIEALGDVQRRMAHDERARARARRDAPRDLPPPPPPPPPLPRPPPRVRGRARRRAAPFAAGRARACREDARSAALAARCEHHARAAKRRGRRRGRVLPCGTQQARGRVARAVCRQRPPRSAAGIRRRTVRPLRAALPLTPSIVATKSAARADARRRGEPSAERRVRAPGRLPPRRRLCGARALGVTALGQSSTLPPHRREVTRGCVQRRHPARARDGRRHQRRGAWGARRTGTCMSGEVSQFWSSPTHRRASSRRSSPGRARPTAGGRWIGHKVHDAARRTAAVLRFLCAVSKLAVRFLIAAASPGRWIPDLRGSVPRYHLDSGPAPRPITRACASWSRAT